MKGKRFPLSPLACGLARSDMLTSAELSMCKLDLHKSTTNYSTNLPIEQPTDTDIYTPFGCDAITCIAHAHAYNIRAMLLLNFRYVYVCLGCAALWSRTKRCGFCSVCLSRSAAVARQWNRYNETGSHCTHLHRCRDPERPRNPAAMREVPIAAVK